MKKSILALIVVLSEIATAQNSANQKITNYVKSKQSSIVKEFFSFLSIPNIADDTGHIQQNATYIMDMMKKKNINHVQLLTAASENIPPVIYGDVLAPGAKQTIIFYAHYDGQPVNPAQWASHLSPFTPTMWTASIENQGTLISNPFETVYDPQFRIYARGASDDKAGVMAIISAYEAMTASGIKPTSNVKFFFEGEEEAGSPHLSVFLEKYKDLLSSDCWIICDGPVHQSGRKQIVFGVRGDAHLDITVYGPKRPLHSGHYGNWAPNPALMLAKLLASMKDESGRVTVKGFYDDVKPLSTAEKKALDEVPSVDEQMKQELGLKSTEMKGESLSDAINLPSLNINGMQSGNTGKMASNQIPTTANAVLDLRLVLGNDWQKQEQKVIDHIKAQGYTVIDHDPTDVERLQHEKLAKVISGGSPYNAQRTSMDLPIAKKIIAAVQSTTNDQVVLQPTLGGSLPLYLIEHILKANSITVPIANHDNNQHAENENIRLQNLWNGIETMAAIMRM